MAIKFLSNETIDGTLVITGGITASGITANGANVTNTFKSTVLINRVGQQSTLLIGSNSIDDVVIGFQTDGNSMSMGIDRSDSNAFKISDSNGGLGTLDRFKIDTSGNAFFTGNLTVDGTTTSTGSSTYNGNVAIKGSLTIGENPYAAGGLLIPAVSGAYDIGSTLLSWNNIHTSSIILSYIEPTLANLTIQINSSTRTTGSVTVIKSIASIAPNTDANNLLLIENTNASGSCNIRLRGGDGATRIMYGKNGGTDKLFITPRNADTSHFILDQVGNATFAGNVGIGITPSASFSGVDVLQLGKGMTIFGNTDNDRASMAANLYLDAATAFRYVMDGYSGRFAIEDGTMLWGLSGLGSAGAVTTVSTKMTLLNNGNLGIGVTGPSKKLHVYNTAALDVALLESTQVFSTLAFKSSTNASTVTIGIDGAGNASFENKLASGNMTFVTNGAERLRINSTGSIYPPIGPTTGTTYYGYDAGLNVASASHNTFLGYYAGRANTGTRNVFVGSQTAYAPTNNVNYSVIIGYNALKTAANTAESNVIIGDSAMSNSSGASGAVVIGQAAGNSNTGNNNIIIGYGAAYGYTTGTNSTVIGYQAGNGGNSTSVIILGFRAGYVNTAGGNTFIGTESGRNNTSGTSNCFIGQDSGYSNITGASNTFVGTQAGVYLKGSANTTLGHLAGGGASPGNAGDANTFIGANAGRTITTGSNNVGIGKEALSDILAGNSNTCVGWQSGFLADFGEAVFVGNLAGRNNTRSQTVGIGNEALKSNTSVNNVAVGHRVLQANTTGDSNTGLGFRALDTNITGSNNTAIGSQALRNTTSGSNVAVGTAAGLDIVSGSSNTCVGTAAGRTMTTGELNTYVGMYSGGDTAVGTSYNVALGYSSLRYATADQNTAVGYYALGSSTNVSGQLNTAVGIRCLEDVTSGAENTAIGGDAGKSITTGYNNVAMGRNALATNTAGFNNVSIGNATLFSYTGSQNTAVGYEAGKSVNTAIENVFIGYQAGKLRTAGIDSIFIGSLAGFSAGTGAGNTVVGRASGYSLTDGTTNTFYGRQAGYSNTGGNGNTLLGYNCGFSVTTSSNVVAIGKDSGRPVGDGGLGAPSSNNIQIGNNSHNSFKCKVLLTVTSDKRDKTNFKEIPLGLDFVTQLKPTSFQFKKDRELNEADGIERYGFLAQDILELEGDNPVIIDNEDKENLKYTNGYLIPVLVKAIQELKAEIEILKKK